MLLTFVMASAVLTLVPGPDLMVVLRAAVRDRRAGVLCGLGAACGALAWGGAAALGLALLLHTSAWAYGAVRLAGAGYLLAMGLRALWHRPAVAAPRVPALATGLLSDLFNPKTGAFYVAVVPQLVPTGHPLAGAVLLFAAIDAAVVATWFLVVSHLAGRIARRLTRPAVMRRAEQAVGLLLIGAGLRTGLEGL